MNGHVDSILTSVFRFMDFHSVTHHDSSINKQPVNVCYEFMNNFFTQGGWLVLFVWFCNRCIDMRVILLWALMYASAHNINYMFLKPTVHRDHHLHEDTNYGLDIADIIFDTKYDLNDIEDYNHISINLIVITAIMVYFF
jgi:sterol desaturase/sphingolipid hydroxylase (fatty acid hydroxylase superfamily)